MAGATGYLGGHVVQALKAAGWRVRAFARSEERARGIRKHIDELVTGDVTRPETLAGMCDDVDVVFSSLGITRQKDGLTYMDVDYGGNKHFLEEARRAGVGRFIYISVLNGPRMRQLAMVDAKERFVDELKASGMGYAIVRPNGFFSDMEEVLKMARKGRVYLFGDGHYQVNPISGEDLAEFCVGLMKGGDIEVDVGGPQTSTQEEVARMAFRLLGRRPRITHVPEGLAKGLLVLAKTFTTVRTYGPLEFFITAMTMDMVAPEDGSKTLEEHYRELIEHAVERRAGLMPEGVRLEG